MNTNTTANVVYIVISGNQSKYQIFLMHHCSMVNLSWRLVSSLRNTISHTC